MNDDFAFYVTHYRCSASSHERFRQRDNGLAGCHPHERRVFS